MNIEVTVTPAIINVVVTPRVVEVVVTPQSPIEVNLDPGGVSAALLSIHTALPDAHHAHTNKADLDAIDQELSRTSDVIFNSIIITGEAGGTYRLYVDADGAIGTEQIT